ncbi:hypothetical protein [Domibacillus tundrae]|uniref:hypothetical protein n=1 Tax=Domibacillus tundrae TaxID=1587527 RepID=UPI000617BF87|nr:hypothetical protein [Domibacillus tundrae]
MKTMKEQLQQWLKVNGKPDFIAIKPKAEKPPQRKQETLTDREWKEPMGIGRDRFKRHRGSIRRK